MDDHEFGTTARRRRRFGAPVGMVVALAVLAFGCSKADPNAANGGGATPGATDAVQTAATIPEVVNQPSGAPKDGGKLVFGIDTETDGFDPTVNRWGPGGFQEAYAFFDPLVMLDSDLNPKPYLVQSFATNDGFFNWDVKLRQGITFHDGTPFDADAVKKDLDLVRASTLTGAALTAVSGIDVVDPYTLRVHMNQAWAAFPYAMSAQIGFIASPKQLDDKANGPSNPVGTGPFTFKSWERDNKLVVLKNASYWRQGLPHLDEVEFRPIVDIHARIHSLEAGDINAMSTATESAIKSLSEDASHGDLQIVHSKGNNDTNNVLINTSAAPVNDIRIRQAMAYAIDRKTLDDVSQTDPLLQADSPFQKDSPWYKPEPDYPKLDVEKAKALVKSYEAEKGPVEITFDSIPENDSLQAVQALASMWTAIGIKVNIKTYDQPTFVANAVAGKYQVMIWRQFGAADPDGNYVWWIGANSAGPLALNMARNQDPVLDEALKDGRSTIDLEPRQKAYGVVADRLAADLPYLWLSHTRWVFAADNKLRGIQGFPLPDGGTSAGLVSGVNPVTGMWLDS